MKRIVITTKKEKAALELMKESVLQLKDYIEDHHKNNNYKSEGNDFSLLNLMMEISNDWFGNILNKFEEAKEKGFFVMNKNERDKIKSIIDFFWNSSGEIFFAPNLFDLAHDLLKEDDEVVIRITE